MFGLWGKASDFSLFETRLESAVRTILVEELGQAEERIKALRQVGVLEDKIHSLKETVADLEIQRAKKKEEFDRREREIEHKVGLQKKRTEFEVESARKEALLDVREENLVKDRKRFDEHMEFYKQQMETQTTYLKELVEAALARTPDAKILATIGGGKDNSDD